MKINIRSEKLGARKNSKWMQTKTTNTSLLQNEHLSKNHAFHRFAFHATAEAKFDIISASWRSTYIERSTYDAQQKPLQKLPS